MQSEATDLGASCLEATSALFLNKLAAEADLGLFRELLLSDHAAYVERNERLTESLHPDGSLLSATSSGSYFQALECMRPARFEMRSRYDKELLATPLVSGRRCSHALCAPDNCGLHVRDAVVLPEEAQSLIQHGVAVLEAEDARDQASASSSGMASLFTLGRCTQATAVF